MPASRRCSRRSPTRGPTAARARSARGAAGFASSSAASARARAVDDEPLDRRCSTTPSTGARAQLRHARTAASAARRSSRPRPRSSSCSPAARRDAGRRLTLDAMAHGGIYDQLGGGFARYSVDDAWLVPHFEKMLYDNALLARAYLHGWQAIGDERYRAGRARRRSTGAARDARPRGRLLLRARRRHRGRGGPLLRLGRRTRCARLASGSVADAADAVIALLRASAERATSRARNILHVPLAPSAEPPAELDDARRACYADATRRVWPGLDDKRLCSWNALMIAALADAGAALGAPGLPRRRASAAPTSCWRACATRDGRLLRTWKDGRGAARRLPRGPRVPGRGAAHPVRGDVRGPLVRRRRASSPTR